MTVVAGLGGDSIVADGDPTTDREGDNKLHNGGKKYNLTMDLASNALLTYPSDWGPGICTMPVQFARPQICFSGEMQVKREGGQHIREGQKWKRQYLPSLRGLL